MFTVRFKLVLCQKVYVYYSYNLTLIKIVE